MDEAIILSQGNELTTGAVVDTNANWLANQLWACGVSVRRIIAAPDRLDDLIAIIGEAAVHARFVISTGGLGPTRDDLTAEAVARAFGSELRHNAVALQQIEARYQRIGRPMAETNRKQALLPVQAAILENRWGTAPGFTLDVDACSLFFLPGVPREMRPMFDTHVRPALLKTQQTAPPVLHIIRTVGIGESELESRLSDIQLDGLEIGYRSTFPENHVKLLFAPDVDAAQRDRVLQAVLQRIGGAAYGVDCGDLAEVVGRQLTRHKQTLALAESCTAGAVSAWLADTPGASQFLKEAAVVYSNESKVRRCGVSESCLREHGAVSEPVARQLAEGIRDAASTTFGIGITGVAGPGGGTPEKPVGRVFVAIAGPTDTVCRSYDFRGDRSRVRTLSAVAALNQLRRLSNAAAEPEGSITSQ